MGYRGLEQSRFVVREEEFASFMGTIQGGSDEETKTAVSPETDNSNMSLETIHLPQVLHQRVAPGIELSKMR